MTDWEDNKYKVLGHLTTEDDMYVEKNTSHGRYYSA
jgi:hypothetical protein